MGLPDYTFALVMVMVWCHTDGQSSTKPMITQVSDDVIKWKHFLHYWPFVWGIHQSLVNSPHKGQWCRALMFSLTCVWINDWVNNREAHYLRGHCTHYDITAMETDLNALMLFLMLMVWKYLYSCLIISNTNMTIEINNTTQWNYIIHWFIFIQFNLVKY